RGLPVAGSVRSARSGKSQRWCRRLVQYLGGYGAARRRADAPCDGTSRDALGSLLAAASYRPRPAARVARRRDERVADVGETDRDAASLERARAPTTDRT